MSTNDIIGLGSGLFLVASSVVITLFFEWDQKPFDPTKDRFVRVWDQLSKAVITISALVLGTLALVGFCTEVFSTTTLCIVSGGTFIYTVARIIEAHSPGFFKSPYDYTTLFDDDSKNNWHIK